MNKNNTKCVVCGKQYYYCNTCKSQDPSWMISFCCDNCRQIYNTVAKYGIGKLTQEQANKKLKELDLSKENSFTDTTKKLISEIKKIEEKEIVKNEEKLEQEKEAIINEALNDATITAVRKARPSRSSFKKKR